MTVIIVIAAYILIAAAVTFALYVAAVKTEVFDPYGDYPWPILCGIFWPLAAPIAAALIAAQLYLDSK